MGTAKKLMQYLTTWLILPLSRPVGRVVVALALFAVAVVLLRNVWLDFLLWSAVPMGIWLSALLAVVVFSPLGAARRWHWLLSALLLVLVISAGLAFQPFPPLAGIAPLGGEFGRIIAFAPLALPSGQSFGDDTYLVTLLQAEARIFGLVAITVAVLYVPLAIAAAAQALLSLLRWIYARTIGALLNLISETVRKLLFAMNSMIPWRSSVVNRAPASGTSTTRARRKRAASSRWPIPPIPAASRGSAFTGIDERETAAVSRLIEDTLQQYGVETQVENVFGGPSVTMYGLTPGWRANTRGSRARVKVQDIISRERDLALALKSSNIRFEPVLTGESNVGLEVPNQKRWTVKLGTVLSNPKWQEFVNAAALPMPLGIGNGGEVVFADLSGMPHMLVAGATGSGKSVCINTIITSLLLFRSPEQVRLILVDPKRVELAPYRGVPHLITPVVTDTEDAVNTLNALVTEMDRRLRVLEDAGKRNIGAYNSTGKTPLPYLVAIVDEMADLMLLASDKVERSVVRLAQLGRAPGIHMIIAAQRPSVDVITGIIKANFPSRVAFSVQSNADSRTILDEAGAEKLLGNGDMLFFPSGYRRPKRLQGVFLSDEEIAEVTTFWRKVKPPVELPVLEILDDAEKQMPGTSGSATADQVHDTLLDQALELARGQKTISVSYLQRRLGVGFPRAGRLMDELEKRGVVSSGQPGKARRVLLDK